MSVLTSAIHRRLLINGGSIFAGEAAARMTTFLVAVVVARSFGPGALGQYGFAVAVTSVLLLVPDAGLHLFIVRELAARPERLRPVFWGAHWLKLPLLTVAVTFSVFFARLAIHEEGKRILLYVLLLKIALQTFSQASMAVFKAFERMHYIAVQQFANAFFTALWVGGALLLHSSLAIVVMALIAGQLLETGVGWRFVRKYFSPGGPCHWNTCSPGPMLVAGLPIGIAAILQAVNLRLDILTLSPFVSSRVLGSYQAAAWFPIGCFIAASLMMTTLFPKLARLLRDPGKPTDGYVQSVLKSGILLMTLGSIVAGLFAPNLLHILFGPRLVPASPALRILVVALPFIFVNTAMFYVFVAAKKQGAYLAALLLGVIAGGALSILLSERYGPNGTAVAYVLREICVSSVYLGFMNMGNLAKSAKTILGILAGCGAGLMVLAFLLADSITVGVIWSIALIAGILIVMRGRRPQEMLLLTDESL
jgi:O-antigen/teichoic acid export membrane protein